MDALALVVCIVAFVGATLMFSYGALIVVRRVTRRRWAAATRRAQQQARGEPEPIPPRFSIRAAVLQMLGGAAIGGVIVLRAAFWIVGWLVVGLAGSALLWVIGSVLDNAVVETVLSSLIGIAVVASIVGRVVSGVRIRRA